MDIGNPGVQCESCKATDFRRSRLQFKDVSRLLALQYPVRCLACSKRQRVAMTVARRAVPSLKPERRPQDGAATNAAPPMTLAEQLATLGEGDERLPASARLPVKMPDLRGVRLPHVANLPPGTGENLTRSR